MEGWAKVMEMEINLNEVKEYVTSDDFIQHMLKTSTNISVLGFIIQTVLEKIDELMEEEEK